MDFDVRSVNTRARETCQIVSDLSWNASWIFDMLTRFSNDFHNVTSRCMIGVMNMGVL